MRSLRTSALAALIALAGPHTLAADASNYSLSTDASNHALDVDASGRSSAGDTSVLGLWWAEGGAAQVEIATCDANLCGRVVWLRSPFDENGCPLRDEHNPDPALRGRELVGVELLRGLRPSPGAPDLWADGQIYDPTSGRTYSASLSLDGHRRLLVRGYLGIRLLGRTTTWIRVGGVEQCTNPS